MKQQQIHIGRVLLRQRVRNDTTNTESTEDDTLPSLISESGCGTELLNHLMRNFDEGSGVGFHEAIGEGAVSGSYKVEGEGSVPLFVDSLGVGIFLGLVGEVPHYLIESCAVD